MSQVRLKCPVCNLIAKVNEDVIFRQPVVRCARCRGLVEVARHRLSLLEEAQADALVESPVPVLQTTARTPFSMISLVFFSIVGLVLLTGLCWVVFHFGFRQ